MGYNSVTGTVTVVQGAPGGSAWKVDGSAVTQPVTVSGTLTTDPSDRAARLLGHVTVDSLPAVSVSNFPATQPVSGTVTVIDPARVFVGLTLDRIAGVTSEALATLAINRGGATSSAASYTVTSGKTLRIQAIAVTILDSSTTVVNGRVRVRQAASGITAASPVIAALDIGNFPGTAAAGMGPGEEWMIPDGLEIGSGQQVAVSHLESSTSSTVSVCIVGFEY